VRRAIAEYFRMADLGIFEDRRMQLIEGRIYQMPPQRVPHSVALELVNRFFSRTFSSNHRIRIQSPFLATNGSEPEPDFAVISGNDPRAAKEHPSAAVLIVEIGDTSIGIDHDKLRVFSMSGVPEYWIVNIPRRMLEVYRDPIPGSDPPEGPAYQSIQTLAAHENISPLAAQRASVSVAELLP
jgi:Uma2 family endonuclease